MKSVEKSRSSGMDSWRDLWDMNGFWNGRWPGKETLPAVNIAEDEKSYTVDVVTPGFKKDDLKINVEDNVLTVSAERKHEASEGDKEYSRREYAYSSFTRSFRLPDNAKDDAIAASYHDGVLQLTIPKSEEEVKATKEIKIR